MPVGLLMVAGGVGAGAFGSLLGLGGGILIVPLLTLGFGLRPARGGRRLAGVRDHDQQRRGRACTSSATSRTCGSG